VLQLARTETATQRVPVIFLKIIRKKRRVSRPAHSGAKALSLGLGAADALEEVATLV